MSQGLEKKMRHFTTEDALSKALNRELGRAFQAWKKKREGPLFRLGLSGGSVLSFLRPRDWMSSPADLRALGVYPIDERYVPFNHPDSNAGQISLIFTRAFSKKRHRKSDFMDPFVFPCVNPWLTHLPLAEAAAQYEDWLASWSQKGRAREIDPKNRNQGDASFPKGFDFLLLGAGPDGHIASLFPGHPALLEKESWVVYLEDSPKPPPQRLSLSLPFLQASRRGILLLTKISSDKAGLYQRLSAFLEKKHEFVAKKDAAQFASADSKEGRAVSNREEPLNEEPLRKEENVSPRNAPLLPVERLIKGMGEGLEIWTLP